MMLSSLQKISGIGDTPVVALSMPGVLLFTKPGYSNYSDSITNSAVCSLLSNAIRKIMEKLSKIKAS